MPDKITDFQVLDQIMKDPKHDLKMSVIVRGAQKVKNGVEVRMGVDEATGQQIMLDMSGMAGDPKYIVALYIIPKAEYHATRKKLEEAASGYGGGQQVPDTEQ